MKNFSKYERKICMGVYNGVPKVSQICKCPDQKWNNRRDLYQKLMKTNLSWVGASLYQKLIQVINNNSSTQLICIGVYRGQPWWKTLQDLLRSLKILEDLQRSWKTRIFQGSSKDLAQILEDP